MKYAILAIMFFLSTASSVYAESGADALMKSIQGETKIAAQPWGDMAGVQLGDPFSIQLFSQWQTEKDLPFEVNQWVLKILKGDYKGAAHLYSAIQTKIPGSFETTAKTAQAYLYRKLDLPQTFASQWIPLVANAKFRESRLGIAFEQAITPGFETWWVESSPTLLPDQMKVLASLDATRGPLYATLRAWAALRKQTDAANVVSLLPAAHPLKIPLSQTVALGYARKKDLAAAAKVLKEQMEPGISAKGDPKAQSAYYIQIARLLYQAGALDGASQFYEKIPNGAPEYLRAREELTWIRLRQGNTELLRGDLESLGSGLFDKDFVPEIYLVRAVSNLKLCYYDKAEQDISKFIDTNRRWTKEIAANLDTENPTACPASDFFSRLTERAYEKRVAETAQLETLAKESIEAALPAVGEQSHWKMARTDLKQLEELAKKQRAAEYRRQWKNWQGVLKEAIRKMQFVKVELMSQVRQLSKETITSKPTAQLDNKTELSSTGDMSFPFDGVVWPDELFRLRSSAQAACLQARK